MESQMANWSTPTQPSGNYEAEQAERTYVFNKIAPKPPRSARP